LDVYKVGILFSNIKMGRKDWTNEHDSVFDPFLGVGTTTAAAAKNNRIGIGCEVIKEYYNIAVERTLQAVNGELKTRPMKV